jgi:hypothetical protein
MKAYQQPKLSAEARAIFFFKLPQDYGGSVTIKRKRRWVNKGARRWTYIAEDESGVVTG